MSRRNYSLQIIALQISLKGKAECGDCGSNHTSQGLTLENSKTEITN